MAHILLLRYDGAFPPQNWEELGAVQMDERIWQLELPSHDAGGRMLEALAAGTPHQVMKDTLVLEYSGEGPFPSIAGLLRNARSLDGFMVRKRYAWLLGDLAPRSRIFFHPIVDLQAAGEIFGHEALCRLTPPEGGLLNGGQAFELAQSAGRIADLDVACQTRALVRKATEIPHGQALFLNVLPQNLLRAPWRAMLVRQLEELAISPHEVVIEVVESERTDPAELATACDDLRRGGLRIALDDMGAGFNGLSTLAAVRADFIKIDRGLVHQAQRSRVRTVLLEAIVSMAQRLGTKVIAEGLERPEDILFCREMSIGYAQGFYFALPAEAPATSVAPLPTRSAALRAQRASKIDLTHLMEATAAIDIAEPLEQARRRFTEDPGLASLVAVDDGHPVGLLQRGNVLSRRTESLGKACEPIPHFLPQEISVPTLARRLFLSRREHAPWIVLSPEGKYMGNVTPAQLIANILSCRDSGGEIHPLTQLPTGPGLRHNLESRLAGSQPCSLVYVDLDHFKAYNDRYGFVRGDAMIRLLSELLRSACLNWSDIQLGHIGGDDFLLIAGDDLAPVLDALRNVLVQFHSLALHLYDEEDARRGYFLTEDALPHPIANVSVAVVTGATGRPASAALAAERAASLKKLAKSRAGSVIVIEGAPPEIREVETPLRLSRWERDAISALNRIAAAARGANPHLLDRDFPDFPYFEVVFELDAHGIQRHPNWINPEMYGRIKAGGQGTERGHQLYFRQVRERLRPYVSPIYLSNATEDFCLTVSVPILAGETLSGVLVADINLATLAEWTLRDEAGNSHA